MAMDLWETGVKLMVVYPGVIDTDLFSLPDNDIPDLPVQAEPVSVAVDAGVLSRGRPDEGNTTRFGRGRGTREG
jgi:hypothetical protein